MRRALAATALALGTVVLPFAGTAHASCLTDLIADPTPSNPHSITYHYITITTTFVDCVAGL